MTYFHYILLAYIDLHISGHKELRVEGQLADFFDRFRFSLFSESVGESAITEVYERIEDDRPREDPATKCNVNLDAAACIAKGDLVKGRQLVTLAEEIAPYDIHTYCNKGKLLCKENGDAQEVKTTAFKMLELYTDMSLVPRIRFQIDFAYFLAEASRTGADREKSCQIFSDCLLEIPSCSQPELTRAHCVFMALKTKVRRLKTVGKDDQSWRDWGKDTLHQVMDDLVELSNTCTEVTGAGYQAYMWLWLAEVQFLTLPIPGQKDLLVELDEFKTRSGEEITDAGHCLQRGNAIAIKNKGEVDCKVTQRIAKLCLENAFRVTYDGTTKTTNNRIYWLTRALDDSLWWVENFYESFMCQSNIAQALRQIWATNLYNKRTALVNRTFSHINHGKRLEDCKFSIGSLFSLYCYYIPSMAKYHLSLVCFV